MLSSSQNLFHPAIYLYAYMSQIVCSLEIFQSKFCVHVSLFPAFLMHLPSLNVAVKMVNFVKISFMGLDAFIRCLFLCFERDFQYGDFVSCCSLKYNSLTFWLWSNDVTTWWWRSLRHVYNGNGTVVLYLRGLPLYLADHSGRAV
jgi:hypothetical protein